MTTLKVHFRFPYNIFVVLLLFLTIQCRYVVSSSNSDINETSHNNNAKSRIIRNVVASLVPIILNLSMKMCVSDRQDDRIYKGRKKGARTVRREHCSAEKLFGELSDTGFRQMYRMSRSSLLNQTCQMCEKEREVRPPMVTSQR